MIHESKGKNVNEADLAYDTELRIFFIDVSRRRWDTEAHLNAHFDRLIAAWKKWSGVKCDMCAGYAGFQFDMTALGSLYRTRGQYVGTHCFDRIVRWGLSDDPLMRTTQRSIALATHRPSHIYETKEEAVKVILGLRQGSITITAD
ncbi:MAG: hypothetical protein HOO96_20930 [Polyangiaceae bacterium]|nr:hypothetical protein [Polyangiaceae bacterium]